MTFFSNKQFGFISGRSTVLQLLYVIENWTKAIDEGFSTDVVYMDYQKAFDTVPHRRLIGKLSSYGIRGETLKWVEAFLKDRRQRVVINGESSKWSNVTSGIPQGSVLGPILFVIYINDMPEDVRSDIFLFADDTKISKKIKIIQDCECLQNDLNSMYKWTEIWLLKFHPLKCKVMMIGNREENVVEYSLPDGKGGRIALSRVESEKDIGVTIDTKLTFRDHMTEKVNKANKVMGIIRRTYTYLDERSFLCLYKALVRPHLEYANQVWAPHKAK